MKYHGIFFVVSLIGMFFLYETGDHGAETPGFHSGENGMINWVVGEEATHTLNDRFTFLHGQASAAVSSEGDIRMLQFQNPDVFLVTKDNSYSSMQMVLNVHSEQYKGNIILTHHVHNAQNYGYLALHPDGSAELGGIKNGQNQSLKKALMTGRT